MLETLIELLLAVLGSYGFSYYLSLNGNAFISASFTPILFAAVIFVMLRYEYNWFNKMRESMSVTSHMIFSGVFSFVFSLSLIWGGQLSSKGYTSPGFLGKGFIIIISICLGIALFPVFSELLFLCRRLNFTKIKASFVSPALVFFASFICILLLWIPVFLAYYPGILSYDFNRQSISILKGFAWYDSYQPIIHTLLMALFFKIGSLLSSLQLGMALYSIFQMLVLSLALGYVCNLLYRLTDRLWPVVVSILFFGLMPIFSMMAISATKDTIFTALFVCFIGLLVEKTFLDESGSGYLDVFFAITGILLCMFRNNAIYAIAAFMFIYFFIVKGKEKLKVLILSVFIIGLGFLSPILLQKAIGSEIYGSQAEAYSVIMQTVARVGYLHGEELKENGLYEDVNKLVNEKIWERYMPNISDPVKSWVTAQNYETYWKDNMPDVLKTWLKIGRYYPNEYIDGALETVRGYWYMDDTSFATVLHVDNNNLGVLYTFNGSHSEVLPEGIEYMSYIPWLRNFLEYTIANNGILEVPFIFNLFKPALYNWILLFGFCAFLYFKRPKKALIYVFPLTLLLTHLLGPTAIIRYVLPIIASMPILIGLWVHREPDEIKDI